MEKPDFKQIGIDLMTYSKQCRDNGQLGNSNIILSNAEIIRVMAWTGEIQEKYSKNLLELNEEVKLLKDNLKIYSHAANAESRMIRYMTVALGFLTLIQVGLAYGQYKFAEKQVAPLLDEQARNERSAYNRCKEPGNATMMIDWGIDGMLTCTETYERLRGKFEPK